MASSSEDSPVNGSSRASARSASAVDSAPGRSAEGIEGEEGTFNIRTFWLVVALTRASQAEPARLEEARLTFEQMLGYANRLGLYAEETGTRRQALGNFPQAFTHLGPHQRRLHPRPEAGCLKAAVGDVTSASASSENAIFDVASHRFWLSPHEGT
jgi:hypothetical protein